MKIKVSAFVDCDDIIEVDDNLSEEEIWQEVNFFVDERLQKGWERV